MEYSMVLNKKTDDRLFYEYGASKKELDGIIVIDKKTMEPSIQKKSENTIMRLTSLAKLLKAIAAGEEPEEFHFVA